jgi:hypothetical protein
MRNCYTTLLAATALAIALVSQDLSFVQAAAASYVNTGGSTATWGKATEIPGLARLNPGGGVDLSAVSCTAPGDCAAGGVYGASGASEEGFVVSQHDGVWGKAIEVPGLGHLNAGGYASVDSLSCAATGDCSAGGQYTVRSGEMQAFVVTEHNGVWGSAIEVPGSARLDVAGGADIGTMSCPKPGDCSAGGDYLDPSDSYQAFVVTERNGRWGKAIEVPGSARLNAGGGAAIESVSCAAVGYCSAGGDYVDAGQRTQALVVTERNGRWGKAIEVPGSAHLNTAGDAEIESVSCSAPGDCSAGGSYFVARNTEAFVVTERNGRWGTAIEVPGSGRLNTTGSAEVDTVSCAAPGDCSAGGDYSGAHRKSQAFVVTERNGRWGTAIEVPGSGRLNTGGLAQTESVSCAAPGRCSAAGEYANGKGGLDTQGFVVTES